MMPPLDFDGWWNVFLAIVEIYVDETDDVILGLKMTNFDHFHQKLPILTKFTH